MKKFGIAIFIVAILIGVIFANLFSFGRASGRIFNFSIGKGIKGSGVAATETRNVRNFKGVDVGGVFQVEINAGKDFAVEVSTDDNLVQYVKTEVEGDILKIATSESIKSQSPLVVRISAPNIESLEASGASKVALSGVKNQLLDVDISGASKVEIAGETVDLEIDVSGASGIDAENLKSENANVDASGASRVTVFVTGNLISDATGASKIGYAGNPTSVDKNSSGASKIYPR